MREELAEPRQALDDPDMRELAEEELAASSAALPEAEHRLAIAMLPRDSADSRPAMLEIRAGTGGDEAALFAADLLPHVRKAMPPSRAGGSKWSRPMPTTSAASRKWSPTSQGNGVFAKLKFESGVHRVQRVPVTESGGRIHTSRRHRRRAARAR